VKIQAITPMSGIASKTITTISIISRKRKKVFFLIFLILIKKHPACEAGTFLLTFAA
jgi:hypothetical protein